MSQAIYPVLSRKIRRFARSSLALLPGHGFFDGGCVCFALAMREVHDAAISTQIVGAGRPGILDHVVLQVNLTADIVFFLDADGCATKEQLLYKLIQNEMIPPGRYSCRPI